MKKIAIIHFSPVEMYPPIMNFLNYLASLGGQNLEVRVYTTHASEDFQTYRPAFPGIKMFRNGQVNKNEHPLKRYINYLLFYTATFFRISTWRPESVLYYETLSSFPALLYKKFVNVKSRLLVHYHEYISASEYRDGMTLNRWFHQYEKEEYSKMSWISHTNQQRMDLFKSDNFGVSNTFTFPNYPPLSWLVNTDKNKIPRPVKFVYVGALSLETTYMKEFSEWIVQQNGQAVWDIYSSNLTTGAKSFLAGINSPLIRFCGSIGYFSLPARLKNYDIGVVLYNGHIPNYIYNAPNKLFEYYACGLDVWFPKQMIVSSFYTVTDSYPKIIAVDFGQMDHLNLNEETDRRALSFKPSAYFCESVFGPICRVLNLTSPELLEKGN